MIGTYGYIFDNEGGINGVVPIVEEDSFNRVGWEELFHHLPQAQLEILVCLYLGLKPLEIVEALGFKDIAAYYNASFKLRRLYREQKYRFIDYNESI